ncbi:N-acetyltransferase [Ramlibacter henchirensis]|uniref:N-acetyltransferase n=1 Tax=Ramlibacter henchirensis TaxID=204072 RepID=A0A4Z0C345_9BURK|nr:GNAT family N-acetyltransferase [Ramlibacter henchirensis]TFZ05631.1 N-acetyltransferase [Ramlibacter henchirensis]
MTDPVLVPPAASAAVGRALPDGVTLRRLTADDIEGAQALSHGFQWPFRVEDWRFAFALGEGVAAIRDGELVGTALRWLWGPDHATVGHVMVAPRMQGRRLGQHLMHALMAGLQDRTVLLHATAEGRGVYERMGFAITGEIRQHQGQAPPAQVVALPEGERLRPLNRNDADFLISLDTRSAGMPREPMLRQLLADGETVVLARDSEAVGFATVRRFGRGHAIGPVVAPDLLGARALIAHWCSRHAGKFLRIDVDAASGLPEWLEEQGLPRVGSATTMVRGGPLERGPAHGGWALVTQALG